MSINIANAGAKVINLGGGIVVDGYDVAGGYFVIDDDPTVQGTIPNHANKTGQLCYCTKDSKFYQCNGSTWVESTIGAFTKEETDQLKLMASYNLAEQAF